MKKKTDREKEQDDGKTKKKWPIHRGIMEKTVLFVKDSSFSEKGRVPWVGWGAGKAKGKKKDLSRDTEKERVTSRIKQTTSAIEEERGTVQGGLQA